MRSVGWRAARLPVSPIASIERQRPLSFPMKISCGLDRVPCQGVLIRARPVRSCSYWRWWCCARRSPWQGCIARDHSLRQAEWCPARRNRGQHQIVIAVCDCGCSQAGIGFQRRGSTAFAKATVWLLQDPALIATCILPDALILIIEIDSPGKRVASERIYGERSAKDGARNRTDGSGIGWARIRCQAAPGLCGHARPRSRHRSIGSSRENGLPQ